MKLPHELRHTIEVIAAGSRLHPVAETAATFNNVMVQHYPFIMAKVVDLHTNEPRIEFYNPVQVNAQPYRARRGEINANTLLALAESYHMDNATLRSVFAAQQTRVSALLDEIANDRMTGRMQDYSTEIMALTRSNMNLAVLIKTSPDKAGFINVSGQHEPDPMVTCH